MSINQYVYLDPVNNYVRTRYRMLSMQVINYVFKRFIFTLKSKKKLYTYTEKYKKGI